MASNYTENYGLCQWEATDQVLRTEFNEDNAKVDAALQTLSEQDTSLNSIISAVAATAGNCQMELITYTGTGTYGEGKATKINFSEVPDICIVWGGAAVFLGQGGAKSGVTVLDNAVINQTTTWKGTQLSFFNTVNSWNQLNGSGSPYWAVGLKQK